MKEVKITCDSCGADLTTTGNCIDYRLGLEVQRIYSRSAVVTAMLIEPPIPEDMYFCGMECLAAWINNNFKE